jgi:hypothetical protein
MNTTKLSSSICLLTVLNKTTKNHRSRFQDKTSLTFKAGNAGLILTSGNGLTLMPECRCRIDTDDCQKKADAGLTSSPAFT